jgi:hypothetical protein
LGTTKEVSVETEESPLLEAVTRERLVQTHQAGKGLAGAVMIVKFGTVIICTYESCGKVVNKSNLESKVP